MPHSRKNMEQNRTVVLHAEHQRLMGMYTHIDHVEILPELDLLNSALCLLMDAQTWW
jgi:hypothetical protein